MEVLESGTGEVRLSDVDEVREWMREKKTRKLVDKLCDEKTALTLHKLLHGPLIVLVLVHSVPAIYLALQRWGWMRKR